MAQRIKGGGLLAPSPPYLISAPRFAQMRQSFVQSMKGFAMANARGMIAVDKMGAKVLFVNSARD